MGFDFNLKDEFNSIVHNFLLIITEASCLEPAYCHLVPGQVTTDRELWLVRDVVIHQYDQQRGLLPAVCLSDYKYQECPQNHQQDFTQ